MKLPPGKTTVSDPPIAQGKRSSGRISKTSTSKQRSVHFSNRNSVMPRFESAKTSSLHREQFDFVRLPTRIDARLEPFQNTGLHPGHWRLCPEFRGIAARNNYERIRYTFAPPPGFKREGSALSSASSHEAEWRVLEQGESW